jgi:hypothetical protein
MVGGSYYSRSARREIGEMKTLLDDLKNKR